MIRVLLLTVVIVTSVSIQPILARTSNYVIQIRPSDDQTFRGGAISKFLPDGGNITSHFINSSGASNYRGHSNQKIINNLIRVLSHGQF